VICRQCQASVPEESAFCLRCGTRLVALERLAPVNGDKGHAPAGAPGRPVAARTAAGAPRPAAAPGSREAYALSFKALADERLRYRVARWLCEVAPAHQVGEVQQGLAAGSFATFLALTEAEANAARQRIEALGAHPALWQLKPAGAALMAFLPEPRRAATGEAGWSPQKKLAVLVAAIAVIFVFGAVVLYQMATAPPRLEQSTGTRGVVTPGGTQ
jgi:hypothetical protein